jgi:N-carbamoylputrescine amidase
VPAAAGEGAQLVCLQELTLSAYLDGAPPEDLPGGPTFAFAARAAREAGVHVIASLYERPRATTASGASTRRSSSRPAASWPA